MLDSNYSPGRFELLEGFTALQSVAENVQFPRRVDVLRICIRNVSQIYLESKLELDTGLLR